MEQVTEQYWGESEVEAIYEELTRRDNVAGNIAALTFRANINYQETDGLDQLLGSANAEIQRRFWNTLAAQSVMESNFGTRMINKENCKGLLGEMRSYVWDDKAAERGEEKPVKQKDHGPDALRYYCYTVLPKWRIGA